MCDINHNFVAAANKRKPNKKQKAACEETDSAISDNGWVECKNNDKYKISRMGNPMLCLGATFCVVPKYSNRFLHGAVMDIGKIHSVVRQKGSSVPWFKFYDFEKYPSDAPERGTAAYMFVECASILSTDSKKTGIRWTRRSSVTTKQNPKKKTYFDMELCPSKGFDDKLDALRKRKQRKKDSLNSSSDSESASSDETDESDGEAEVEVRELDDDSEEDYGEENDDDNNDTTKQQE